MYSIGRVSERAPPDASLRSCSAAAGVFLNGCSPLHPLGKQIQDELPHLTEIGWDSRTLDDAAAAFSKGFYDALAQAAALNTHPNISSAYEAARQAFEDAGVVWGDPAKLGAVLISVNARYTPRELDYVLTDGDSSLLLP